MGYSPRGCKGSDTAEHMHTHTHTHTHTVFLVGAYLFLLLNSGLWVNPQHGARVAYDWGISNYRIEVIHK